MEKYININDIFESCFNHIIANNIKKAYYSFIDNYYKHPNKIELLYGVIISYIMLDNIRRCIDFLEKEIAISPLSNKIRMISNFIKLNSSFENINKRSVIFNIGLFLKRRGFMGEAKIFFRVCQTLEPDNSKTLTALGECAILECDIEKGIKLFSYAAKNHK